MAKIDFCFTYYDGDAARDMQHMDRLARGGYSDFVLSQRKFGALSLDFIKRILGKDFEEVWPQIEVVCLQTDDGKFYLEWLENSIADSKKHAKHQSENGSKGGRLKSKTNPNGSETKPNQSELKPNESQIKANQNPNISELKPLEDEDEDVISLGGVGDISLLPLTLKVKEEAESMYYSYKGVFMREGHCQRYWSIFKQEQKGKEPPKSIADFYNHFVRWVKFREPLEDANNESTPIRIVIQNPDYKRKQAELQKQKQA